MSWSSLGNSGVPCMLYLHWHSDKDIWRNYTTERLQTRSFKCASSKVMKVQRQMRSKKKIITKETEISVQTAPQIKIY